MGKKGFLVSMRAARVTLAPTRTVRMASCRPVPPRPAAPMAPRVELARREREARLDLLLEVARRIRGGRRYDPRQAMCLAHRIGLLGRVKRLSRRYAAATA